MAVPSRISSWRMLRHGSLPRGSPRMGRMSKARRSTVRNELPWRAFPLKPTYPNTQLWRGPKRGDRRRWSARLSAAWVRCILVGASASAGALLAWEKVGCWSLLCLFCWNKFSRHALSQVGRQSITGRPDDSKNPSRNLCRYRSGVWHQPTGPGSYRRPIPRSARSDGTSWCSGTTGRLRHAAAAIRCAMG
jgi:hypothetical protein